MYFYPQMIYPGCFIKWEIRHFNIFGSVDLMFIPIDRNLSLRATDLIYSDVTNVDHINVLLIYTHSHCCSLVYFIMTIYLGQQKIDFCISQTLSQ